MNMYKERIKTMQQYYKKSSTLSIFTSCKFVKLWLFHMSEIPWLTFTNEPEMHSKIEHTTLKHKQNRKNEKNAKLSSKQMKNFKNANKFRKYQKL